MDAMEVCFVYFDFMKGSGGKYYEGLASISAVLKQNGHTTSLCHITDSEQVKNFDRLFEDRLSNSDIVGFSSTTNAFRYIADCANIIKQNFPGKLTVCGGVHPTLSPEKVIEHTGIDIVCVGEGEYPMLELCDKLQARQDITGIQNLWVKQDGSVFRNPIRPVIKDLDTLPVPDRDLFDFEHSVDREMNRIPFLGSRGCPFNCTHCCNHALKNCCTDKAAYVRFKSVDRLIEEVLDCMERYPNIKNVHFLDDILTLNQRWFTEFAQKFKDRIGLPYVCNSRYDIIKNRTIDMLYDSGCSRVQFGLESGDEYIRIEVLGRKQTRQQIVQTSEYCRSRGLTLFVYTMVGIPMETPRRALNTVKLTAQIQPDKCQTSIYYPYEQTELYNLCQREGFLTEKRLDSYFETDSILNLPNFPRNHILFAYENFSEFVNHYKTCNTKGGLTGKILEKTVDFLWLHPRIYNFVRPKYLKLKRLKKSIRRKKK